jgi:hypothetical protein
LREKHFHQLATPGEGKNYLPGTQNVTESDEAGPCAHLLSRANYPMRIIERLPASADGFCRALVGPMSGNSKILFPGVAPDRFGYKNY